MVCHKQAMLSTIHEQLTHLSFHRLELLARAGITPKEIANMYASINPVCVYSKAHQKPPQSKEENNNIQLRIENAPGQVVSVYKIVIPTPGFILIEYRLV